MSKIEAAAVAWRNARDEAIGEAYLRCPSGPSKEATDRLNKATQALIDAVDAVFE